MEKGMYIISEIYKKVFFLFFLILISLKLNAQQYNAAGTAVAMSTSGCYQLTNTTGQAGAVWNIYMINLNQAFDITLTLNFGNRPDLYYGDPLCGADGMSFILQPLNTGTVGVGSGVGFHGITPSLGVVMDTYHYNPTDPPNQHISINKNGDELHGTTNELVPPSAAIGFPANITDGLDHLFRLVWNPTTTTLKVFFGNATTLPTTPTLSYTGNIVANIFSGNPNVFWGVGGSTGGCWNVQTVCIKTTSNFTADSSSCVGDSVHFTDNSVSGLPIQAYMWDFGDGTYSGLQNPTHIYNNPGTYNVTLEIFNSGGFFSGITHQMIVHPKPTVVVNSPSICIGDSATLNATGAATYTWNNGLLSGAVKKVAPIITSSYIVTGVSSFGCVNKDTSLVTVNPLPIINTIGDTICFGDTATLFVSGGNNYLWITGDTLQTIYPIPLFTTNYSVVVTSINGCIDSSFATVLVNNPPILSITSPVSICDGDSANLTVNGGVIYQWDNGLTSQNISVSPGVNTVYSVEVTDANGCKNDTSTSVTIISNPIAVISADMDTVCSGNPIVLTASGGNTFLWNTGENSSSITIYPINNATFNCTVYNSANGTTCSNSAVYAVYAENCNTLYIPNAFVPIGVNKIFKPIGNFSEGTEYYLVIYNRWGQLIFETYNFDEGWDGTYNGKPVQAGVYVYYLRMRFGNQKANFERTGKVTLVE
jgi:gliding motility-associated-like protein